MNKIESNKNPVRCRNCTLLPIFLRNGVSTFISTSDKSKTGSLSNINKPICTNKNTDFKWVGLGGRLP